MKVLSCQACDCPIEVDGNTRYPIECPKCRMLLMIASDEDSGGNYYVWLEELEKMGEEAE